MRRQSGEKTRCAQRLEVRFSKALPAALLAAISSIALACSSPGPEQKQLIHLGVLPTLLDALGNCPVGSNRDPVTFKMHDETETHCGAAGSWVSPQAEKYRPPICHPQWTTNTLSFCRVEVEADSFRPLTVDAADTANFYAVLLFDAACPANSRELVKIITNESGRNMNMVFADPGHAAPNSSSGDILGNATTLHFCFFRAASSAEEAMERFPELGFPYAVFHDFDGPQPGWVLEKRWLYSDDENTNNMNSYELGRDPDFESIIENPLVNGAANTYFDMARVR